MASTQYKYSILVTFAHQNTDLVKLGSVPVYYAPNKSDEFHFNKKSIRIYANRWKKKRKHFVHCRRIIFDKKKLSSITSDIIRHLIN
jgi:hypothetical protein